MDLPALGNALVDGAIHAPAMACATMAYSGQGPASANLRGQQLQTVQVALDVTAVTVKWSARKTHPAPFAANSVFAMTVPTGMVRATVNPGSSINYETVSV